MAVHKVTNQTNNAPMAPTPETNKLIAEGKKGKASKDDVQKAKDSYTPEQLQQKTASGRSLGEVFNSLGTDENRGPKGGSDQSNAAWAQDLNDLSTAGGARSDGTVAGDGSVIAQMETNAANTLPTDMVSDPKLQAAWGDGTSDFAKTLRQASPALDKLMSETPPGTPPDFTKIQASLVGGDGVTAPISLYRSPTDGTIMAYNYMGGDVQGFKPDGSKQYTNNAADSGASGDDAHAFAAGQHYVTSGSATLYLDGGNVRPYNQTTDFDKNFKDPGPDWQTK